MAKYNICENVKKNVYVYIWGQYILAFFKYELIFLNIFCSPYLNPRKKIALLHLPYSKK